MAIEVAGVNKSFGSTPVLHDIDLRIAPGSLSALLGPSGGGKSTLLRIIAGLEAPDTGTVFINGADATYLPPQRRSVGFVFQHYAAFKHLTVYRNVAFGLEVRHRPKAEIRRRVQELLELVHLEPMAQRYPSQLSGGQRQRMALARALAVQPQVLLLDEPFGALDAQVRKELRTWLRRLHDEVHVTTVFVTHDQEEAMDVADEIVLLADGAIQQSGAPHDIYDNPANAFVMSFLGPVTHLDGLLVRPHDIDVSRTPTPGATRATVTRVVTLGFEIRIEASAGDRDLWAQLDRASAKALGVQPGDVIYLRPVAGAQTIPVGVPAPLAVPVPDVSTSDVSTSDTAPAAGPVTGATV